MSKESRTKMPPSKTMSRKERRKEERKLKKARRDAFAHRNFNLIKDLKDVDTAHKAKRKQEYEERVKLRQQKKKEAKVEAKMEVKQEVDNAHIQGLKLAIQKDEKELKQLEKNLKFRKKKGVKTVPSAFSKDGLDYILDVTDSEKIKTLDDVAHEHTKDESDDSESDGEMESLLEDDGEESEAESETHQSPKKTNPTGQTARKSILKPSKTSDMKDTKKVLFANSEMKQAGSDSEDLPSDEDIEVGDFGESEDDDEDYDSASDNESKAGKTSRKRSREESELKEDIYGRLRDKQGNIVKPLEAGAYIPPAKRLLLSAGQNEALHKKLKGLINKVSEGSMQAISSMIESLYLDNSRADVNETMFSIIMDLVVTSTSAPERLIAELAMLLAIISANVGSEVGAFFLQKLVKRFDDLLLQHDYGTGKLMENLLLLIANLYNFKLFHCKLMFDIFDKFVSIFGERDIELILLLLKTVGSKLRKDDPARLKQAILDIQSKARSIDSSSGTTMQSRIRFMLDILVAVRNNNFRKIPNFDSTHVEHLKKIMKNFMKGQNDDELNISLQDLLKADEVGRWWIVGSAWEGRKDPYDILKDAKAKTETAVTGTFSKKMIKLAKQQGMNTDIRRNIFCILGTSEDFEDAFMRLLQMKLNHSQEREIIHVMLHCCLSEKDYNPFYGYLAEKFCTFDRRFMITVQFSVWDKFKEIDKMDKQSRNKFGHLLTHLLLTKALSLSVFKVVEFGMESKKMIRLMVLVLTEILMSPNETTMYGIFERIAPFPKLKTLRQGLQVFMRIHVKEVEGQTGILLQERIEKAESAMFSHQTTSALL